MRLTCTSFSVRIQCIQYSKCVSCTGYNYTCTCMVLDNDFGQYTCTYTPMGPIPGPPPPCGIQKVL